MGKVYNFNAGPAILPQPVLEQAQQELLDYQGRGMSILEMSHRSKEYEMINSSAEETFKRLLGLGDDYRVLFLQGGASTQFAMLPLNFLPQGAVADYIVAGAWGEKAYEEATKLGQAHIAASTQADQYRSNPRADEISLSDAAAYVHITSNETIQGVQWHSWPDVGDRRLVADMSSDILVVLVRQNWLDSASKTAPTMLRYATHAKNNSLYNTPPVFGVYMLNLVLDWIEERGGLEAIGERNRHKAATLYAAIDNSAGFYRGHAAPDDRSLMNITFRLPSEELEKKFVAEATAANMIGLAGHRSVGGIRASIYNAMTQEGCAVLANFMGEFARKHG